MRKASKYWLSILVLLFLGEGLAAQGTYTIQADSVKLIGCDSSELIIENHTQNVPGFLFNTGNGRTIFRRGAQLLGNGYYLIGADTLKLNPNAWVQGGNSFGATGVLGTLDSNHLDFYTNNTFQARLTNTGSLLLGSTAEGPWKLHVNGGQLLSGQLWQDNGYVTSLGNGLVLDNAIGSRIFSYNKLVYQSDATGDEHLFRNDIGGTFTGNLVTIDPGTAGLNASQLALKVLGTGSQPGLCVNMQGYTGIGTLLPVMPLDVNGDVLIRSGNLRLGGSGWAGITQTCLATHLYNACGSAGFITLGFNTTSGVASGIPDPITVSQFVNCVGISTNSPQAKLHVTGAGTTTSTSSFLVYNGGGNELFRITDTGYIGIGTYHPTAQLHTSGTVRFAGLGSDNTQTRVLVGDANGNLFYRDASTLAANDVIRGSLAVNGAIRAKELTLTARDWPDYVFDSSYLLMPLSGVKEYIHQNAHLPGVAAASAVEADGVDVGNMQAVLLKKIEELTLYTIKQDEEIKTLKEDQGRELAALKEEVTALRQLLLTKPGK